MPAHEGHVSSSVLAESSELRIAFWDQLKAPVVDLPPRFHDKADIFSRSTTDVLAAALSAVNELRSIVRMTSELASTTGDDGVYDHIRTVGEKIIAVDDALKCAFEELIRVGKEG